MRKTFHLFALLGLVLADGVVADENGDIEKRRAFFEAEGRATRFQSAEDAFPHRVVHAGDDVWTLLASEASRTFAPTYQWEGQTYDLDAFNERTATSALLILKDGKIVKEIYLAGSTQQASCFSADVRSSPHSLSCCGSDSWSVLRQRPCAWSSRPAEPRSSTCRAALSTDAGITVVGRALLPVASFVTGRSARPTKKRHLLMRRS